MLQPAILGQTVALLRLMPDVIQWIGTLRVHPHQADQQGGGVPRAHACSHSQPASCKHVVEGSTAPAHECSSLSPK
jgi:hypothetical protein